jgi:signal transduction histidine kinase
MKKSTFSSHTPTVYEEIYSSALKLLNPLSAEKTYKIIVEEAKRLVGAKHGTIFLIENKQLKRVYASSSILYRIHPRKRGKTFHVYKDHVPYILSPTELTKAHPEFKELHFGSDMGVPLTYGNKTFGVLAVFSKKDIIFTKEHLSTLLLFSPVASLAIRNMQLYSEVKKSLDERDLFISMAAHELKTPLTTASLYSQLLLRKTLPHPYSETKIKIKLSNEINRLTKLVNELLQVNQIKTGNLQYYFQKCNLYTIIDTAITAFQNVHPSHKIIFKTSLKTKHCFVNGDYDKLFQTIINLLNNAAKFSPKESSINIFLSYVPSYYTIAITDHGLGIKKQDLPKIFQRFFKGSAQKKEGLGLGLFLVKNIIDRHRGEISVTSHAKEGTTFSISLPIYNNA